MSVQDCLKIKKRLTDPDDKAKFEKNFKDLVDSGIPAEDAYKQAAELTMEDMLGERNEVAAEIRQKKGEVEDLTIEELLGPVLLAPGSFEAKQAAFEEMAGGQFSYSHKLIAGIASLEFDKRMEQQQQDLVEEPSPDEYGLQGDMFVEHNVGNEEAATQIKDNLNIEYKQTQTGEVSHGVAKVETPQEAAHVVAGLRKSPQEEFHLLVTDKNKKPVGIIKHTKGTATQSHVGVSVALGSALNLPGAANIWMVHNHPSGIPEPSQSDVIITRKMVDVIDGTGINMEGHVIIGAGREAHYLQKTDTGYQETSEPIKTLAANRTMKLPVYERTLKKRNVQQEALTSPKELGKYIRTLESKSGLILGDNKNRPIGIITLSKDEMGSLRDNDIPARILRVFDKTNAQSVWAFINHKSVGLDNGRVLQNLGNFLAKHDNVVTHHDTAMRDNNGNLVSWSMKGLDLGRVEEPFYSKKKSDQPGKGTIENVTEWTKESRAKFPDLDVEIVNSATDINPEWDPAAARGVYWQGKVYLFASQINSQEDAEIVLAHEVIGHYGMETVIGKEGFHTLVKRIKQMRRNRNRNVMKIVRQLEKEYTDPQGNYELSENQEAREIIAHLAEEHPNTGILQDIWNRIKLWLARHGFKRIDYDQAIINNLIYRAAKHVTGEKILNQTERGILHAEIAGRVVEGMFAESPYTFKDRKKFKSQAFSKKPPAFYSALTKAIADIRQPAASKQQWIGTIQKLTQRGVKLEEIEWSGVIDYINQKADGRIEKTDILDYLESNEVRIMEVQKRDQAYNSDEDREALFNEMLLDDALEALDYLGFDTAADARMAIRSDPRWYETWDVDPNRSEAENDAYEYGQKYRGMQPFDATRHEQYQMAGERADYREMLLLMPLREMEVPEGHVIAPVNGKYHVYRDGMPSTPGFDTRAQAISALRMELGLPYMTDYISPEVHWHEKNVLAFVRFNTRDIDGKKTLFIEEIQSDWHQTGRKQGYVLKKDQAELSRLTMEYNKADQQFRNAHKKWSSLVSEKAPHNQIESARRKYQRLNLNAREALLKYQELAGKLARSVPDAPFKRSWPLLVIKRMIRHAVDQGFDQIAWTPGKIQADRYDLAHYLSQLRYSSVGNLYDLSGISHEEAEVFSRSGLSIEEVEEYVGREIADKIRNGEGEVFPQVWGEMRQISGLDLRVGGKGMESFYDKMLPTMVSKYVKKLGSQVTQTTTEGDIDFDVERQWGIAPHRDEQGHRVENEYVLIGPDNQVEGPYRSLATAQDMLISIEGLTSEPIDVWTVEISDKMRQVADRGQPMFSKRKMTKKTVKQVEVDTTGLEKTLDKVQEKAPKSNATEYMNSVIANKRKINKILDQTPQLKERVKQHEGTSWAKSAMKAAIITDEIHRVIEGKLKASDAKTLSSKVAGLLEKHGKEGVWKYLDSVGVVGHAGKPGESVNSSFRNCDPSKLCAKFCYSTNGRSGLYPANLQKEELLQMAAEDDPKRLAKKIAVEFKDSHPVHWREDIIRMFEAGDLSNSWVKVITELNKMGIRTHVFSKHPDLLAQLHENNSRLLSIDASNTDKAAGNDLPLSITYTSKDEIPLFEQFTDRFDPVEGHGVILPIEHRGTYMKAEEIEALPEDMREFICPVNAGKWKGKLAEGACQRCQVGTGCHKNRATAYVNFGGMMSVNKHLDAIQHKIESGELDTDEKLEKVEQQLLEQLEAIRGQKESVLAGITEARATGAEPAVPDERAARETAERDPDLDEPAFSKRHHPPTETTREQEIEEEVLQKLGLEPQERRSMLRRLRDLKDTNWRAASYYYGQRLNEGLFDGLAGLKYAEESLGAGIGAKDYAGSAYVSARLATGVADMMTHVLHYGGLKWNEGVPQGIEGTEGFLKIMGDLGEQADNWMMWMAGNRAQQLMKGGREQNLTKEDIDYLVGKRNKDNQAAFDKAKKSYNAMNKAMLDFAEEAGLIDPKSRAEWESEWYIPFYRQDEEGEVLAPHTKRGLSHQTAGIKHLAGSEKPTADLLENVLANWMKMVDASVKNMALVKMVNNLEGSDYIQHESLKYTKAIVPKSEIAKRIQADRDFAKLVADYMGMPETANNLDIIQEMQGLDKDGFQDLWAITVPKDPRVLQIKRNGKSEYWRVAEGYDSLLRATGHLQFEGFNDPVARVGRWFKRLLTTGVTASPDFMLRNFIRDAAHAWTINKDNFKFGKDSYKGLKAAFKEDSMHRAMMAGGASFQGGYVHGTDPEATAQIVRRKLEQHGLTREQIDAHMNTVVFTAGDMWGKAMKGWQKYREYGDKVENANRIATAKASLEAGKPMAQVLYESKDLMDYSLRGNYQWLMWFTDMIPFLNARMQGLSKLGRAAGKSKADFKIVAAKASIIVAGSIALAMWNEDDERYKELQDWDKDAYWHVFMGDVHIRIPKPFEIGVIAATIPERMYNAWVAETQPNDKLKWSLKHNAMETLGINPIPQFALPVFEVVANKNFFFDNPIHSMADKGVDPRLAWNENTSDLARYLTQNDLANGLGISPKRLEHLYTGYTGTLGIYALNVADWFIRWGTGAPDKPEAEAIEVIPGIKSILRSTKKRGTKYHTDMYDRLQEAEQIYKSMNRMLERGLTKEAREYRREHREKLAARPVLGLANRQIQKLRDKMDQIMRSNKSAEVKRAETQRIQAQINKITERIAKKTEKAFTE